MHPKIAAAGSAGAVTVLVVWVLSLFGLTMPGEVASALTTVIAVVAGWFQPNSKENP